MVFLKVKAGDRVKIDKVKSEEFTVRLSTFWFIHGYNYIRQEINLDDFGDIWCEYVTEIL